MTYFAEIARVLPPMDRFVQKALSLALLKASGPACD
jgi:hypothetical protein